MLTAMLPLPAGSTSLNDSVRPVNRPTEKALVAPPTPVASAEANLQYQRKPVPDSPQQFEPSSSGTTFAAAILSGALSPTPTTLAELYKRIGASDIPDEVQMRLKNLQV